MSFFDTTTDYSVFGGSSLRLVGDSAPPNVITGRSNPIPVHGRDAIVVSAYVFAQAIITGTEFSGLLTSYDNNGNELSTIEWLKLTAGNGQFIRYYLVQDISKLPYNTSSIRLSFALSDPSNKPAGQVYVDCVKCEYGNRVTGYSESVFYEEICKHIGGFGVPTIGTAQLANDCVTSGQLVTDPASLGKLTGEALQYNGAALNANVPLNVNNGLNALGKTGITQMIQVSNPWGGIINIEITNGIITSIA